MGASAPRKKVYLEGLLTSAARRLVARYHHILYISCNPTALREDVQALRSTHTVCDMAFFDHFPYTRHAECGVYLQANTDPPFTYCCTGSRKAGRRRPPVLNDPPSG